MGRFSIAKIAIVQRLFAFLLAFFYICCTTAQAQLLLSPVRHVVTLDAPEAIYVITNASTRRAQASVAWVDLRALEQGYERADAELRKNLSASPFLIVSPSFLDLAPGEQGLVSVTLRRPLPILNGERRSHLLIESHAPRTPLHKANASLPLDIDLGLSTPVVLRGNVGDAGAELSDTKLTRDEAGLLQLETTIVPKGDFSSYGALVVYFVANDPADPLGGLPLPGALHLPDGAKQIARLSNVAGYLEAKQRRFAVPLNVEFLPAGVLTLRYEGEAEFSGDVFDERSFDIPAPE